MEFKEFKQTVKDRCQNASACSSQFKRLIEAETFVDLFTVLKDNINWVFNHKILDPEILLQVREDARASDIYVNENCSSGILFASGNATVRASGNATVRASENATVRASENATVDAKGASFISSFYAINCKVSDKAIYRCDYDKTLCIVPNTYTITHPIENLSKQETNDQKTTEK